ncbi:MAG: hypothetical protein H5T41_06370 [Methanomassiliicoccales archaeon]|nr:hypothetical protein [Methanomassiliicoccales archaeon]
MENQIDNEKKEAEPAQPKKGIKKAAIAIVIAISLVIVAVAIYWLFSPSGGGILDSDGDGISDHDDAFPSDSTQWADTDGDGYGDNPTGNNPDAFPNDPNEWKDTDGDGYGDNSDEFPNNPYEHVDSDNDGVGDNSDAFPYDSTQWSDRDGDGYGDNPSGKNPDAFPDDPTEWKDSDRDGVGDNADFYDNGNGKIKISIDWYQGDGTADFWTYGDPYFEIRVDLDNDGIFELTYTSAVFTDTETLDHPYSIIIDAPDNLRAMKFEILVYDSDVGGYEVIDYNPNPGYTGFVHSISAPFTGSWDYDGSDDLLDEIDCELRYSISVVGS